MAGRLHGKVATITGDAIGIGRARTLTFPRERARVAAGDVIAAGMIETLALAAASR